MKLFDLVPDDVAVFAVFDDAGPFVLTENHRCQYPDGSILRVNGSTLVRRLGRGHLVPARIAMEGEAVPDLAEQVRELRDLLAYAILVAEDNADPPLSSETFKRARAALAATAPTPTEAAK